MTDNLANMPLPPAWKDASYEDALQARKDAIAAFPTARRQVENFLHDCTIPAPSQSIGATELYAAYARWAVGQGVWTTDLMTTKTFGVHLGAHYARHRTNVGVRYVGLVLTPEVQP